MRDSVTSETKRMKSELDQSAEVLLKHTDTDSDDVLEWSDDEASSGEDFCYDEASCEADSTDDGSLCGELSENILTNLKFQLDPMEHVIYLINSDGSYVIFISYNSQCTIIQLM